MRKLLSIATLLVSIIQLAIALFIMLKQGRYLDGGDIMQILAIATLPLLVFASFYTLPDWEERKLRRQCAKAELRKKLSELSWPSA